MSKKELRILAVHGLCGRRLLPWVERWKAAIREAVPQDTGVELVFEPLIYDDLMADLNLKPEDAPKATAKLLRTGLDSLYGIQAKGFFDVPQRLKWGALHIMAWVEDPGLQAATRERVLRGIKEFKPRVLLAHSLGSLAAYNALIHPDGRAASIAAVTRKMTLVTFGSQIANAYVIGHLNLGRVEPVGTNRWINLHNKYDNVFTPPIRLWDADAFAQVETPFGVEGCLNHAGDEYLRHLATADELWTPLVGDITAAKSPPKAAKKGKAKAGQEAFGPGPEFPFLLVKERKPDPRRRALLVGINDYPDPAAQLDGCVNDTFRVSAMLQEFGFLPDGIRLCLNQRATAAGILERMEWLLSEPRPGDKLFFYYSGHGAQLHTYGQGDAIDRKDETLVPWDFAWTPQTSITDDQIFRLYSQLPYETELVMVFDCCHSGGIHKSGQPRAKGLTPPDDIQHRGLLWNKDLGMWERRELNTVSQVFEGDEAKHAKYFGKDGITARLGRAASLRVVDDQTFREQKEAREGQPSGPYLPMILEACQENQYAYEYRHGVVSYGAFTYALVETVRRHVGKGVTFEELIDLTTETLEKLEYEQKPQILGPQAVREREIGW